MEETVTDICYEEHGSAIGVSLDASDAIQSETFLKQSVTCESTVTDMLCETDVKFYMSLQNIVKCQLFFLTNI
jgi:hypothetical protein